MENLTDNQKVRLSRLSQGLSQTATAKKLFMSLSFLSLIESGARKVPTYVGKLMAFNKNVKWYETTISTLLKADLSEKDRVEAIQTLDRVLKL